MGTWTSLVVLSLAVVSTLSFPRPGAEYKIPTVGLGSRSQYYVLHSDGSYKYGYDSGDGLYEEAMALAPGKVSGAFGYKDATGEDVKVEYTADERGFIPRGQHLVEVPENVRSTVRSGSSSSANVRATAATYSVAAPSVPASVPVEVANIRSSSSDDGSYSFGYKTSSSSRSESADAHNSVTGEYAFVADDGINRGIKYIAGSGTGYIAEGDSLPVGPSVPGALSGIPTGRILPVLSEEEANALAAATSGSAGTTYSTGSQPTSAFNLQRQSTSTLHGTQSKTSSSDASYSFKYDAGDSTRSENADADLNIEGSYSFVPPEGHRLTVNYIAGSETGFVATGDHLPVAPEAHDAALGTLVTSSNVAAYSAPVAASSSAGYQATAPVEVAQVRSSASNDGSYSFGYETASSSRLESADNQNSVTGQYTFTADDGINREIRYTAGSGTGYIAEGDSLPQGPPVPGAESGIPTGRIYPILSEEEANALAASTSGSSSAQSYSAQSSSASATSATSSDASYSFKYDAEDSARQETADANLNIQGSYSFTPPEGHRLTVNYVAGADTGFVAKGDHLPVAPKVAATPYAAKTPAPSGVFNSPSAAVPAASSSFSSGNIATKSALTSSSDASYSFNYDAGDSSRSESADSDLNVQGSYSFTPPEGQRLTVNYIAGSGTGFIAEGAHLPVAPKAADSSIASTATQYIAPSSVVVSPFATSATLSTAPVEVAQVRSDSGNDGSYSFGYETSSSSRSEAADAHNSVTGHYAFVADDGINRQIKYIAGSKTGYIAEGDSLPVGPSVPGAESGIPTGRILPILSEEEANALARSTSSASASNPLLKSNVGVSNSASKADASYAFSFASDAYSRNEKADAEGNVVGSYTFLDEHGNEHTVNFVAGKETGFLPEGFPTGPVASPNVATDYSAPSVTAASSSASSKPSGAVTSTKYSSPQKSDGHSSQIVGDVLLHQYSVENSDKYGYSFSAVRR